MNEQFIGCTLSIEVGGGLGFYQGVLRAVNANKQFVTLEKVLHNGKPNGTSEVTISASDILDLKILHSGEKRLQKNENQSNSQQVCPLPSTSLTFKKPKVTNECCSKNMVNLDKGSIQLINNMSDKSSSKNDSLKKFVFKPVKIQNEPTAETKDEHSATTLIGIRCKPRTSVGEALAYGIGMSCNNDSRNVSNKSSMNCISEYGFQRKNFELTKTPNKRLLRKYYRDETTFGTPIDEDVLSTEFDFEKNLALFDKQAVMDEIQNLKPDVIKQADRKTDRKYRCDENVISTKPSEIRQIIVPAADAGEVIYATDNGLLVPSVTTDLRMNLLSTANQLGLTKSRQLEIMGRATTEIILSVIGGSHRLEPNNSHQAPVVVILCGANMQGAAGVNCGRQLESQGVQTVVITPTILTSQTSSLLLSQEAQLYSMTTGRITTDPTSLPSTVDLIVDARYDLSGNVAIGVATSGWVADINAWALASRAPIVALDPPTSSNHPLTPRILLSPALPLAYLPEKGKVYLLNLNIPQQVFLAVGIKYTPPFGSKLVIPLHPCE